MKIPFGVAMRADQTAEWQLLSVFFTTTTPPVFVPIFLVEQENISVDGMAMHRKGECEKKLIYSILPINT